MRGSGASGRAPDQCKSHLYPILRINTAMRRISSTIRKHGDQACRILFASDFPKNELRVWPIIP